MLPRFPVIHILFVAMRSDMITCKIRGVGRQVEAVGICTELIPFLLLSALGLRRTRFFGERKSRPFA